MRLKAPARNEVTEREEREQQLRDFIKSGLESTAGAADAIMLIARAPDSLPARILFEMSETLAAGGLGAEIVLVGASVALVGQSWKLNFASGFQHEIRVLRDPRYLDGHEQLVIGECAVWFGDCMRREPDKRDAFASFVNGSEASARQNRKAFKRLWATAVPIYAHSLPVVREAQTPKPAMTEIPASALPAGTIETLEAWQVSTRH